LSCAASAIRSRLVVKNGSEATSSAAARRWASVLLNKPILDRFLIDDCARHFFHSFKEEPMLRSRSRSASTMLCIKQCDTPNSLAMDRCDCQNTDRASKRRFISAICASDNLRCIYSNPSSAYLPCARYTTASLLSAAP